MPGLVEQVGAVQAVVGEPDERALPGAVGDSAERLAPVGGVVRDRGQGQGRSDRARPQPETEQAGGEQQRGGLAGGIGGDVGGAGAAAGRAGLPVVAVVLALGAGLVVGLDPVVRQVGGGAEQGVGGGEPGGPVDALVYGRALLRCDGGQLAVARVWRPPRAARAMARRATGE
ncbi:hypothetical protein [Kitasatospora paranensis]|uniref:Uncharacterized protein n=1 Tax=Kitasatospora paranensis TaxID=258053 RepID=A0ABW2FMF7_9ACTN